LTVFHVTDLEFSWQNGELTHICYLVPEDDDCAYEIQAIQAKLLAFSEEYDINGEELYDEDEIFAYQGEFAQGRYEGEMYGVIEKNGSCFWVREGERMSFLESLNEKTLDFKIKLKEKILNEMLCELTNEEMKLADEIYESITSRELKLELEEMTEYEK
jgi:hypothetical protein